MKINIGSISALLFSITLMPFALTTGVQAEILHEEKSLYRNITVRQENGRRCLLFNIHQSDRNQSCKYVRDTKKLVFHYARMCFAGLLVNPNPERILIAGLGGGTLPTTFHELFPHSIIDVLEIDQAVVNVARDYFDFQESENVKVYVVDARRFIKRAGLQGKKYDYIILDAFGGDYIPEHLLTREFLEEVKQIMSPDGVLVSNTFSTSALYDHESVTYAHVFKEFYNFRMPGSGNRLIIAQLNPLPPRGPLVSVAKKIVDSLQPYGIRILEYPIRMTTKVDWDRTRRVLTDQYSPANLLRN